MKEKKVVSLKIVFEDGSDYSLACEVGLDKDEVGKYLERAFKPEPAEPLIKDEKIRTIVKMWAENFKNAISDDTIAFFVDKEYQAFVANLKPTGESLHKDAVALDLNFDYDELEHGKSYTIAELCGEEE